jgi:hypothetical protein
MRILISFFLLRARARSQIAQHGFGGLANHN